MEITPADLAALDQRDKQLDDLVAMVEAALPSIMADDAPSAHRALSVVAAHVAVLDPERRLQLALHAVVRLAEARHLLTHHHTDCGETTCP